MAIFEKTTQNKIIFDDTEKLICSVENAQNINKHTEYILRIQGGVNKENKWTVSRRYRDFAALHSSIHQSNIELPLPPKKLIGNMQPSFIAERQIALQNYINEILKHQILGLCLPVRRFLCPINYPMDISDVAVQTMSIALRGDGHYELKGPLVDIGWRIHKHYFLVSETDSKINCILSWQKYGPDRHLVDKDLQTAFKSLQNTSHPHIDQILSIHNLESGAYVVRRLRENGSVRDMLYGTEYNKNYLAKYGNPKVRKPFTMGQIAHYGYQILQALKFLQVKNIPHGHIHPGNIAIENQNVQLLDIENVLMGVPCLYRPYLLELKWITTEGIDIYCFGRTLYEMALATPLDNYYCDIYPDFICEELVTILRLCLSSTFCKHGPPTMDCLLYHPFFTRSTISRLGPADTTKAHLKFPLSLKTDLQNAVAVTVTRLKNEQKLLRTARRELRIQEILSSEEELKKHKRKSKKRSSLWKSSSSLADTVRSHSGSTASSPTPPNQYGENGTESLSARSSVVESATPDARSALLNAICSFDKSRLNAPRLSS